VSADIRASRIASHLLMAGFVAVVSGCSWFTDFKLQPKIDPWETPADTIAFRGNPQFSVPVTGSVAPGLVYGRSPSPLVLDSMAAIANPVAADARSLENGRKLYQINCALCHAVDGQGNGTVTRFGMPPISLMNDRVRGVTDGYIFAIMRNGRGLMPSYNRLQEAERWDVVNYIRGLQGQHQVVIGVAGLPGETGATLPAPTEIGPTRPAPYYHQVGSQATVPYGPGSAMPGSPLGINGQGGVTAIPSGADTAAVGTVGRPGAPPPAADTTAPRATPVPSTPRATPADTAPGATP
jgi:mono/diheme cytochrome c family protein